MAEKKKQPGSLNPMGGSLNPIKGSLNPISGSVNAKPTAREPHLGTAHDDASNKKFSGGGSVDRAGAIDAGVGARNDAIDKGLAARQDALNRPRSGQQPSQASGAKPSAKAGAPAKQQKAASTAAVASPASTPNVGNNRIAQSPAFLAPLAAQVNKALGKKIQGVVPVKVTNSDANAVVAIDMDALKTLLGYESRITALEALLAGFSDTEADICPSGTVTILTKA